MLCSWRGLVEIVEKRLINQRIGAYSNMKYDGGRVRIYDF